MQGECASQGSDRCRLSPASHTSGRPHRRRTQHGAQLAVHLPQVLDLPVVGGRALTLVSLKWISCCTLSLGLSCCCLPAPAPASSFRSAPRLTRTVPWEDLADLLRIRLLQANICHWQHHWHVFMCKSSKKTSCSACAAVQVCTFCWRTRCAVPSDRDWLLCKYDSGSSPATNWMVASSRASLSRACGARFQRHQRRACVCAHARALVSQCSMLQTGHVMAQGA